MRAFVFFSVMRFLILMGLLQSDPDFTTLPFLGPPVHLTARVILFPTLRQTILASNNSVLSVNSEKRIYHFLQDQYLAFVLGPGLSQLCLALKLFLALGFDFLIFIALPLTLLPP